MRQHYKRPIFLINNVFWVALGSFNLGGYAVSFSGSSRAWGALVCSMLIVLLAGASLVRFIWRAA